MKGQKKTFKGKKPPTTLEPFKKVGEQDILMRAKDLLEPMCEAEGVELVHLEYQREANGRILRLYIDRPGGVTLDDCVAVSRQSGDLLDVYLDDMGPYRLEVSSPGSNRPLGKKIDYEKFKGSRAKIVTTQPINGQKNFKGTLLGISKDLVTLSIDDTTVAIPYQEIAKAHLSD
ncbi:MAG: ribosome maturation factor RimP [Desulfobacterales bacterium]|nr:MAG: ribosome maturation factor RimP [Desulfobacterales bacterium]